MLMKLSEKINAKKCFDFEILGQMWPIYPLAVSEAQKFLFTKLITHCINR